ncbi:MAG: immune inhibitor A [Candidatus Zixiibacteriota bacterium]|nr:MAG: immune inhibitor A [candidate division Zixibacteria bacterium]
MGRKQLLIVACLVLVIAGGSAGAAEREYIQARVFIESLDQLMKLREMHLDIMWQEKDSIDIVTDSEELAELALLGIRTEVVHQDMVAFYQSRLQDKPMGGYKTYSEVSSDLLFQHYLFPDITTERISIGQSLEGRDIWAIKISDNPEIDEDEPEVLYTGTIHAREVICPHVLLYFINYLCENYGIDQRVTHLVDNRELWFVPVVNPDGHVFNEISNPSGGGMWRKNRRDNGDGTWGVDLNRNFGYMWGHDDVGSSPDGEEETYRGTGPFSEPEAQVMRDFTYDHDFQFAVYYHATASMILWAWGYTTEELAPDEPLFYALADTMAAFNHYGIGSGLIGYPTNGGTCDWYYGELGIISYVFEVGRRYSDGFWPDPSRIDSLVLENLEPNLLMAEYAGDLYSALQPEAPVITAPAEVATGDPFDVEWSHDDTLNPAVQYELVELQNLATITDQTADLSNWHGKGFEWANDIGYSNNDCFWSGIPVRYINYLQSKYPYMVQPNDSLKFKTMYCINDGWDYAYVAISTDGVDFTNLEGNITTIDNPWAHNRGFGICGYTGGEWIDAYFDLSDYVGQEVYFRFVNEIYDVAWACYGMFIDDIYPVSTFETITVLASDLTDTSYSFAGYPQGDYYYNVRAEDIDQQLSKYSGLAMVAVRNPYICGDASGDEGVNLLDVLYLIDFLYGDPIGPAPDPMESADVNADGDVNLLDILYLIDFLYNDPPGPDPTCP